MVNDLVDVKKVAGDKKPGISYMPMGVMFALGEVMRHGALKYGKFNWRKSGIQTPTYVDAAFRHMAAISEGQWLDPDSQQPHAAHVMACMTILLDSEECGVRDAAGDAEA
jgi:hypothetical protein